MSLCGSHYYHHLFTTYTSPKHKQVLTAFPIQIQTSPTTSINEQQKHRGTLLILYLMLYAPAPSSWPMPDRLASKSWTSPDSITSSVRGNFRAHAMAYDFRECSSGLKKKKLEPSFTCFPTNLQRRKSAEINVPSLKLNCNLNASKKHKATVLNLHMHNKIGLNQYFISLTVTGYHNEQNKAVTHCLYSRFLYNPCTIKMLTTYIKPYFSSSLHLFI